MTADFGLAGAPADENRWMAASEYREVFLYVGGRVLSQGV